jgi:hypothetical protein
VPKEKIYDIYDESKGFKPKYCRSLFNNHFSLKLLLRVDIKVRAFRGFITTN